MTKLLEKLRSPTGLIVQGFALGAFLFFTLHPLRSAGHPGTAPSGGIAIVAASGA